MPHLLSDLPVLPLQFSSMQKEVADPHRWSFVILVAGLILIATITAIWNDGFGDTLSDAFPALDHHLLVRDSLYQSVASTVPFESSNAA